jgi:hypothetical protein
MYLGKTILSISQPRLIAIDLTPNLTSRVERGFDSE